MSAKAKAKAVWHLLAATGLLTAGLLTGIFSGGDLVFLPAAQILSINASIICGMVGAAAGGALGVWTAWRMLSGSEDMRNIGLTIMLAAAAIGSTLGDWWETGRLSLRETKTGFHDTPQYMLAMACSVLIGFCLVLWCYRRETNRKLNLSQLLDGIIAGGLRMQAGMRALFLFAFAAFFGWLSAPALNWTPAPFNLLLVAFLGICALSAVFHALIDTRTALGRSVSRHETSGHGDAGFR